LESSLLYHQAKYTVKRSMGIMILEISCLWWCLQRLS